ncbi:hypothetical protein GNI_042410 [Gregarina niphandrodes]|uniref:Uncharacterized protein n=1 Tax=Gregarina niphandrodes TaxID=110365 RepID=A0A023BA67_GRENI|nr:hypothetical protein GNI_042410 [Gregarina niphandrodes]EZG77525.1 hypothetical protein GNI_042410 [Gregarina niphandrodes]|eukprot:XP_011129508.1 hypothetical protein GNI_042410 [Gregarina niphandrodes]
MEGGLSTDVFIRHVGAISGVSVSADARREGAEFFERLKAQPKLAIEVCLTVLHEASTMGSAASTMALIILRQAVCAYWTLRDDALRRALPSARGSASSSRTSGSSLPPHESGPFLETGGGESVSYSQWLATLEVVLSQCVALVGYQCSRLETREDVTTQALTAEARLALHVYGLVTRKRFALPSVFPNAAAPGGVLENVRGEEVSRLQRLLAREDADLETALLVFALVEEVGKSDRCGLQGLRVQDVLATHRYFDNHISSELIDWAVRRLIRTNSCLARTELLKLLVLLFTWSQEIRFNVRVDNLYASMCVRETVKNVVLNTDISLYNVVLQLEQELFASDRWGSSYAEQFLKALGELNIRLACLRFGSSNEHVHTKYLQQIVGSLDTLLDACTTLRTQNSTPYRSCITWLALKLDVLYCLLKNPDCDLGACPSDILPQVVQHCVKTILLVHAARHADDDHAQLIDLALKIAAFVSVYKRRLEPGLTSALDKTAVAPLIRTLVVDNWRMMEIFTEDDEQDRVQKKEAAAAEAAAVATEAKTQEELSSVLRFRGFQLEEDDRYLYRIGLLGLICRTCFADTISLVALRIQDVYNSAQMDDDINDYQRYLLYLATALCSDEYPSGGAGPSPYSAPYNHSPTGHAMVSVNNIEALLRDVGAFQSPAGGVPVVAEETTLLEFFKGVSNILQDEAFVNKLNPKTLVPYLVYLTRMTLTYASHRHGETTATPFADAFTTEFLLMMASTLIKLSVQSLLTYPTDQAISRLSTLALACLTRSENYPLQPFIFDLPVFQNYVIKQLNPSQPHGTTPLINLSPKDLTKIVELVTLSSLYSRFERNDQNLKQNSLLKQAKLLSYLSSIRQLENKSEEEFSICCSILRGLIRAYTRSHIECCCAGYLVSWLFSKQRVINSMDECLKMLGCAGSNPGDDSESMSGVVVEDTTWLEVLGSIGVGLRPETYSQVCALLKLTVSIVRPVTDLTSFELVVCQVEKAVHHQLTFIDAALKQASSGQTSSGQTSSGQMETAPERLHWVRSFIILLRTFVTLQRSTGDGAGSGKRRRLEQLVRSTSIPFLSKIIESAPDCDLFSVEEEEKADVVANLLHLTSHVFSVEEPGDEAPCWFMLCRPNFAAYSVSMATTLLLRPSSPKLTEAEEFVGAVCSALVKWHGRSAGNQPFVLEAVRSWQEPLGQLLVNIVIQELSSPSSGFGRHRTSIGLRLTSDVVLAIMSFLVVEQKLETLLETLRRQIVQLQPAADTVLPDHLKLLYDAGTQWHAKLLTSDNLSRPVRFREKLLANKMFYDQVFVKFIEECKFQRWSDY